MSLKNRNKQRQRDMQVGKPEYTQSQKGPSDVSDLMEMAVEGAGRQINMGIAGATAFNSALDNALVQKTKHHKAASIDTAALVAQIHDKFFTATDKLVEEAKALLASPPMAEFVADSQAERLQRLGFLSHPLVLAESKRKDEHQIITQARDEASQLIRDADYYRQKYPFYRFITWGSIRTICEKYNLVQGNISMYKGTIPEKNLVELEHFKVDIVDCHRSVVKSQPEGIYGQLESAIFESMTAVGVFRGRRRNSESTQVNATDYKSIYYAGLDGNIHPTLPEEGRVEMIICAPQSDMVIDRWHTVDHRNRRIVDVPDPVVGQPVRGGVLIGTAWGPEAGDELVANARHN